MSDNAVPNEFNGVLSNNTKTRVESILKFCNERINSVEQIVTKVLKDSNISPDEICVVVVGSVGRSEAMDGGGADIDLIPILKFDESAERFRGTNDDSIDARLREAIRSELQVKVSKGDDLTKADSILQVSSADTIGTDKDSSGMLTKRILILTEGRQAGGEYPIRDVRQSILDAYASQERTRGRHVLSLCNDVARYYRTLCIEYKGRIDSEAKAWATRNMKLRHSRKFWYFSTMLMMADIGLSTVEPEDAAAAILNALEVAPMVRLLKALPEDVRPACRELLERFIWFIEFMSTQENREALESVSHDSRRQLTSSNPFPALKLNSDVMHHEMLSIIDALPVPMRRRVLDWFLL